MSVGAVDNANGTQTVTYTNTSPASGGVTLAGDTTGPSSSNTTSGLENKALPALPASDQYLHYTSSAWAFSALPTTPTVASGTGISVSGGPAYTVNLSTPVSAANGGSGVSSPTAHSIPITEGASAFNLIGSTTIGKVLHAQGAGNDPGFTSWTMADPGTAGEVLTSDGTNWVSKPQSSQWNDSGGNVSLTGTGTFFTIATIVVTDITTTSFVLVWGQMECHVGTTPTSCTYCISIDSTTTCTSNQHSVTANNGSDSGGGIVYRAFSLSAGAHTFRLLVAESAHSAGDSAAGDIMALSVGN